jgi:biotin operon repressor
MNITENTYLKEEIIKLADRKSTGSPNKLADMLDISERSLYRLLEAMRDEGINIRFSRPLKTYIID